jgi:allophanate hydrolase subunit 2
LRASDVLPLRHAAAESREERALPSLDLTPPARFRVLFGPQDDFFTDEGKRTLLEGTYVVAPASDRMGMRFAGPRIEHAKGYNIVSDGTAPGSIQVPGNGLPIVLLADRQTTGGYPKIATVVAADLPALGRLTPGMSVRFEAVDIAAAEAAHRALRSVLEGLDGRLVPVRASLAIDTAKLLDANLVSGVANAHDWPLEGP